MNDHKLESSPLAIEKNWGDSYLLNHNRIFRNIRKQALSCGYQFDASPDVHYLVFPFSQLEEVLSSRQIPYLNNVDVIQSLLTKTNDQLEWDEISDGFRRNYLFHESCHAMARNLSSQYFKNQEKWIQILMEESFANTCELMGVIEADSRAHQHFYELNSYTFLFEAKDFLKKACLEIGETALFQLLMICYFYANALKKELNEKELDLILSAFVSNSKVSKNLKRICYIPFTLDFRFRTLTTGLYLKMAGLKIDYLQLQQVAAPDSQLISYTKHLAHLALQK